MGTLAQAVDARVREAIANLPITVRFGRVVRALPDAVFVTFQGSDEAFPCDWGRYGFGDALRDEGAALLGQIVLVTSVDGVQVITDIYVKGAK